MRLWLRPPARWPMPSSVRRPPHPDGAPAIHSAARAESTVAAPNWFGPSSPQIASPVVHTRSPKHESLVSPAAVRPEVRLLSCAIASLPATRPGLSRCRRAGDLLSAPANDDTSLPFVR